MHCKKHPVWNLIRFGLVVASVTVIVLWGGSAEFDAESLAQVAALVTALMGFRGWEAHKDRKDERSDAA